jgi:hypothetical protein
VFSVQFLYDRLPLYIVAIYPALTYLVYALVQRTGVFERRNAVVGAACVAFVFHAFYEIFDNLGPQLRWWAWNPDAPTNTPWLASVPLTSLAIFAGASPFGIALLTRLLIARRAARAPVPAASMVLRTIGVGVLTPLAMLVFSVPYGLLGRSDPPDVTGQAIVLWAEIALIGVVALWAFAGAARGQAPPGIAADRFVVAGGGAYLLVFAVLWATALPGYLAAAGGHTSSGAPIGSLVYVIGCAVVCLGVLVLAALAARREHVLVSP